MEQNHFLMEIHYLQQKAYDVLVRQSAQQAYEYQNIYLLRLLQYQSMYFKQYKVRITRILFGRGDILVFSFVCSYLDQHAVLSPVAHLYRK